MSPYWSLVFGGLSTILYLVWAICMQFTNQPYMTWALLCYALANVGLMWPQIRLYL